MNAPYDGDRDAAGRVPPPPEQHPTPDPYLQGTYAYDPYRRQDPTAQDPVDDALYDRAAHPPPPPGQYPDGNGQWQNGEYVGVDGLMGAPAPEQQPYDAYDHLFRDQRPAPAQSAAPDPRQDYGQ